MRIIPDIHSAERQLAASAADLQYSVAEQFPELTINASGGFDALSTGQLMKGGNKTWSIFPFISWLIVDSGRVKAEIHAAQARQEMAVVNYEKTVLTALNEAETSMGNYQFYQQAVMHWGIAINNAQQILYSKQRSFKAGDIAMTEVLDAQQQCAKA